jgi:hypothetical protein
MIDEFDEAVQLIAQMVSSADEDVRYVVSEQVRYLADSARQYKKACELFQADIQAADPDADFREYFADVARAAGLMSKPIKPLHDDQMAAIIGALNTPQVENNGSHLEGATLVSDQQSNNICVCGEGYNSQCCMHGKHQ